MAFQLHMVKISPPLPPEYLPTPSIPRLSLALSLSLSIYIYIPLSLSAFLSLSLSLTPSVFLFDSIVQFNLPRSIGNLISVSHSSHSFNYSICPTFHSGIDVNIAKSTTIVTCDSINTNCQIAFGIGVLNDESYLQHPLFNTFWCHLFSYFKTSYADMISF